MKKIQVLIACMLLSFSGFTFASSTTATKTLPIVNKSNTPIIVQWSSTTSTTPSYTSSIGAGATMSLPYSGTLTACNIFYLKAGALLAPGSTAAQIGAQMADVIGGQAVGLAAPTSGLSVLTAVFVYGDIAAAAGVLTTAQAVAATSAGSVAAGQYLLPANSLSRAAEFVLGTLQDPAANPESATFKQPVFVETFSADGKVLPF